jgi:endonuclease/exonuclease/phosphatase family metal-dependent hydrolase
MKIQIFVILILLSLSLGCISTDNVVAEAPSGSVVKPNATEYIQIDENAEEIPIDETKEEHPNTLPSSDETIRIGAFNVQVFGTAKVSKPEVMAVLADIIRTYDIIAIQEIRDSSQTALPALMGLVNSGGSQYQYVVSERLGRTSSKEQYAYVYNISTVQLIGDTHVYPEPEGTDPFHRQPYIAAFKAVDGNYDAVVIVIHTDPDEATEEINSLTDVMNYSRMLYPDEGDFILMGDLNADGSYFKEGSASGLDEYHWLIDDSQDTTTKSTNYTYDRIILSDASDLYGHFGVHRFDLEYNLTEEQTVAVSDHYPVFAEFLVREDKE